ncbi:ephexin-1 isoform X2 [Oryzias latipes]|uniref:ephexin-1 isoform X2 n=1 Tax=Oryzias latipes TaxID=8090 RepID=UPI000CE25F37|nr:ephexin-1 isoform X2 [Oryzias latipes]
MSVIALFRSKWGQKAQEAPNKQRVTEVVQNSRNVDDEDEDSATGFSREPIRRNSRFYRSMRKKKTAGNTEQTDSSGVEHRAETSSNQRASLLSVDRQASPQHSPRLHHLRAPLPSNGETRSRQASSNRDAVGRTGGVGGETRVDKSAASISQRDFTTDLPSYRTHNFHSPASDKLPEQRTSAFTVQKIEHKMDLQQPSSNEADHHNHRLLRNGESPQTALHGLNIIKSVAFLYQEYRDTSKQQEIEQRRQQENLYPGSKGETEAEASAGTSQPTLQLQLRNNTHSLSLWQNLEAVQSSGLLSRLSQNEIRMQEAMFELVTSEASYYKSLEILETHFLRNPRLINTLSQSDTHFLFSNIEEVMEASERFLMDLEHRIEEAILISDVCDIVFHHAEKHFKVFITYVINQVYQEKTYRRILEENQAFRETMAELEKHSCVRGLSFTSFLILPFQRITRLKLLVQNILKTAEEHSERETNAIKAHQQLEQIVQECNEGVRKMSRTEELISIEKTLEFKTKSVPIISHSRWLLKKGEVQLMCGPKSTKTMRSRKLHQPICLFLFNNLLLITKRSGDKFQVLDSCTRAMLRTEDLEDQGQQLAFVFNLKMLENQEDRTVTYMIKTSSMSDKLRWICALTPNRRTRFTSAGPQHADSPQVQCIQSYTAQESDEISIEMADVLNLLERTKDGWMMGERLHDGEKGWFPSRVVEEIHSKEVRAQNLREAYRVQQAHDSGGGPQVGTKSGIRAGRRVGKNPDFSSRWSVNAGDSNEGTQ